jgi:hypothetical protein
MAKRHFFGCWRQDVKRSLLAKLRRMRLVKSFKMNTINLVSLSLTGFDMGFDEVLVLTRPKRF